MSDESVVPEANSELPVASLAQAIPHLRRPFAPHAVKWKVQASWPKDKAETAIVVGYIDARLVMERLNLVTGGLWSEKPIRIEGQSNALMYELTVLDQPHIDIGIGQGGTDDMKLKALHSDALKRAAVRFGVGVSLYAMPRFTLPVTEGGATTEDVPSLKRRSNGKPGGLRGHHEAHLRKLYAAWLEREGEDHFGKVLDHGDAPDSVGELVEVDESAAAPPEPVADEEGKGLIAQAKALRDEVQALDPDALANFDTALEQRWHSHDLLREFTAKLDGLRGDLQVFEELSEKLAEKLDEADHKAAIDRAKRRASRAERVEVLQAALREAEGSGGD